MGKGSLNEIIWSGTFEFMSREGCTQTSLTYIIFYSILLLSLFLFLFYSYLSNGLVEKVFFSFINLHWGSQCDGACWLPLTGLSWLPSWLTFHQVPSPHLSIHDGFNYNLKGQVKDWLDNSCVSLDFYFIYPALTVTCATTQPGAE